MNDDGTMNALAGVFEGIVPSQTVSADPFVMSWSNDITDVTTNGKIAELKFKVKENTAAAKYPIKITYDEDNVYSVVLDESGIETNVHFDVQNGYINVKEKTQHEHTYKLKKYTNAPAVRKQKQRSSRPPDTIIPHR